ncbi:MAG: hypothetical protein NDJ89_15605 [Oligoflexia bacterium]|nr:hypothetical protein [Oligoflexia bacterium]
MRSVRHSLALASLLLALTATQAQANGFCPDWFARLIHARQEVTKPQRTIPEIEAELLAEAKHPYRTGHYLNEPTNEIRAFANVLNRPVNEISDWVKSEEHALYLYQHLEDFGKRADEVLDYLLQENVYFAYSGKVRGPPATLVTYSLEKETKNPAVTLYYRTPAYPEDKWMDLAQSERVSALSAQVSRFDEKKFLSPEVVPPTGLKPSYLGGYSQEFSGFIPGKKGSVPITYEFAHRSYEIDRKRLMRDLNDLSSQLGETDSFHVHIVFDLPKKYPKHPEFIAWTKQAEDYLYLSGMEEGLHGNDLTSLPGMPGPLWVDKLLLPFENWFKFGRKTLPSSPGVIGRRNFKFFTMGIRGQLYGPSRSGDWVKVGLELRDPTRKLEKWSDTIEKIGSSVEQKIWEKQDLAHAHSNRMQLGQTKDLSTRQLVELGIEENYAAEIAAAIPTIDIPLRKFEAASFFNYRTGTAFTPNAPTQARIVAAREKFIQELFKVYREIKDMRERRVTYEPEELAMAILMDLSTWAKEARVSELFSGI